MEHCDHIKSPMYPFIGVIEDINDPYKLYRVRVRCFSIHSPDKTAIPTNALPWAHTNTVEGLFHYKAGQWVVGFFLDGLESQQPYVLGIINGIPTSFPDMSTGFSDPSGLYPENINESTISRLARNENLQQSSVAYKRNNIVSNVVTGDGSVWSEPPTSYATSYPANKVIELSSGLCLEIDETLGSERVSIYHPKGSWIEMNPDGSVSHRAFGDRYKTVLGDEFVYIDGTVSVTIAGDSNIQVNGDSSISTAGDTNLRVGGNLNTSVEGDVNTFVTGAYNITAKNGFNFYSGTSYSLTTVSDINVKTGTSFYTSAGSNVTVKMGGNWSVDAGSYTVAQGNSVDAKDSLPTKNISEGIVGTSFVSPESNIVSPNRYGIGK